MKQNKLYTILFIPLLSIFFLIFLFVFSYQTSIIKQNKNSQSLSNNEISISYNTISENKLSESGKTKEINFSLSQNDLKIISEQVIETRKGTSIKNTIKDTKEEETFVNEPNIDLSNIYIKAEGNIDPNYLIKAHQEYLKIPVNVRNYIEMRGCQIYITDKNLAATYFPNYKSVQGVTQQFENWIRIEDRDNAITGSLIHEIGHMIDSYLGLPSSSAEFQSIYQLEKNTFVEVGKLDNHSTSSSLEYFAETFRQTILYPSTMQQSAPNTYQYMQNILLSL